jgi:hypothetical protein
MNLLRHLAIRIWISIFFWMLIAIWILPALQTIIGIHWLIIPACLLFGGIYILIGLIMKQIAYARIGRLLKDIRIWERAGMVKETEKALNNAVAFFDSFLLSSGSRNPYYDKLLTRAAQHRIARGGKHIALDRWVLAYLDRFPEDQDAAQIWLQSALKLDNLPPEHFDLIGKLSKRQPKNQGLQQLLARGYLSEGRADYEALQVYRRILTTTGYSDSNFLNQLAHVLAIEGVSDEWALRIYLKAYSNSPDSPHLLKGILTCVQNIGDHEHNRHLLIRARDLLTKRTMSQADSLKLEQTFKSLPPTKKIPNPTKPEKTLPFSESETRLIPTKLTATRFLSKKQAQRRSASHVQIWHAVRRTLHALLNPIKKSTGLLKWGGIGVLCAGIVFFVVNGVFLDSLDHPADKLPPAPFEEKAKPYTIQVAAFMSMGDAKEYIQKLREQDLNVYMTEANRYNKKWYQVRISHFADPQEARIYGADLKSKGLIDDYYVTNLNHP